jgi:hypothetical protein
MIPAVGLALFIVAGPAFAEGPNLGKPIDPADVSAWDISIQPDGTGLPPGAGTPAAGARIYAEKCAQCHGPDGRGGVAGVTGAPLAGGGPHPQCARGGDPSRSAGYYLGPGPWRTFQLYGRSYWTTPDADPSHLYHDVLLAVDEARWLNNGQPSFLAFLIEALEVEAGEHVVHIGSDTGYFTAILRSC